MQAETCPGHILQPAPLCAIFWGSRRTFLALLYISNAEHRARRTWREPQRQRAAHPCLCRELWSGREACGELDGRGMASGGLRSAGRRLVSGGDTARRAPIRAAPQLLLPEASDVFFLFAYKSSINALCPREVVTGLGAAGQTSLQRPLDLRASRGTSGPGPVTIEGLGTLQVLIKD
ncbi:hypothetical protein DV515_00007154 [Chloebia gouldiae]|uniref:Uncharacterized protein n=1 Tax=Chloebia gouldiae TaxID=44316 RepID=A0A3L8SJJ5_CHLGU|nr:hypothetical protein DV515_00007154 [Chloebia gouldiae]